MTRNNAKEPSYSDTLSSDIMILGGNDRHVDEHRPSRQGSESNDVQSSPRDFSSSSSVSMRVKTPVYDDDSPPFDDEKVQNLALLDYDLEKVPDKISPARSSRSGMSAQDSKTIESLEQVIFSLKLKIVLMEEQLENTCSDEGVSDLKRQLRDIKEKLISTQRENGLLRTKTSPAKNPLRDQDQQRTDWRASPGNNRRLEYENQQLKDQIREYGDMRQDLQDQLNQLLLEKRPKIAIPNAPTLDALTAENKDIHHAIKTNHYHSIEPEPEPEPIPQDTNLLETVLRGLENLLLNQTGNHDLITTIYERGTYEEVFDEFLHEIESANNTVVEELRYERATANTREGQLRESQLQADSLRTQLKRAKYLQDQLRRQDTQANSELDALELKFRQLSTDYNRAQKRRDDLEMLTDDIIAIVRENYNHEVDLPMLVQCIEEAFRVISEIGRLSKSIDSMSSEIEEKDNEISNRDRRIQELEKELRQANARGKVEMSELRTSITQLRAEKELEELNLSRKAEELEMKLRILSNEVDEERTKQKKDQQQIHEILAENSKIRSEKQEVFFKLESVEQLQEQGKRETASLNERIRWLEESLSHEKAKSEQLERKLNTTTGGGLQAFREENYQHMRSLDLQIELLSRDKKLDAEKIKYLEKKSHESRESSARLMYMFFKKIERILGHERADAITHQFEKINLDKSNNNKLVSLEKLMGETLTLVENIFSEMSAERTAVSRPVLSDDEKLWKARYLAMRDKYNLERESRYAEYVSYLDRIKQSDEYARKLELRSST